MKRLLKYIPIHMEDNFLKYVLEHYGMSSAEIEMSPDLERMASDYFFKSKEGEKEYVPKSKRIKTEKEVFADICKKKFIVVDWEEVTDISHYKVKVKDSVTPVYALDVICRDVVVKRIVMRDYDKSLRFMDYVCALWFSHDEQTH